jgi:DeoR family transcriptional regulator, aga operon transcriptional repressor
VRKAERMTAILDQLATNGTASVNDLAEVYGVSRATLRRDLQLLEDQRLIARTHGGAVADTEAYELPLRYRDSQRREAKRAIAREALRRIPDGGGVIGLTGGTTTTEVARMMADRAGLTVVTNAINIGALLAVRPRLKLIMTGGVARTQSYELVGPLAEATLAGLNVEIAFAGVDGLDATVGLTTHDEIEAHTNAALLQRSRRVIVVADGSKIGRVQLARIAPPSAIDELITDATADPETLDRLAAAGIAVTVVE